MYVRIAAYVSLPLTMILTFAGVVVGMYVQHSGNGHLGWLTLTGGFLGFALGLSPVILAFSKRPQFSISSHALLAEYEQDSEAAHARARKPEVQ